MTVLSSAKIGTASWRYYADRAAGQAIDYYSGRGEAPGRWHGRGLAPLGLVADANVHVRELEATFGRALHPVSDSQLGRPWRSDGVTGFDLTFSAPKSVSALWALGDAEIAAAAMASHRVAVKAALGYLDDHAALSRQGTDGLVQVGTDGLATALFDHRTSRAGDPQIHTHALVLNKVRCEDGQWRSLDASELFHHKKSAGVLYQAALRNELHARLGVTFAEPNAHGQAEIAGVPKELLDLWSKRTAQITIEATPKIAEYERLLGRALTDPERVKVIKTAVLKTRPGKTHPALSALHATWAGEAASIGWTPQRLARAVRDPAGATPVDRMQPLPDAVLLEAVRTAGLRRAVFSRADLTVEIAARLPTTGLPANEVAARVEQLTDLALTLTETVPLGEHPRGVTPRASDGRYGTVQVLAAEARILDLADRGQGGGYGQVPWRTLTALGWERAMDPAQYTALLKICGDGDFLSVLTAPAGAGKTHTLGAATLAWSQAGYRVIGLAPSARAAAELATSTGGHTDTLAKWLHVQARLGRGESVTPAELEWARLDNRTVLVVDEASMANTLDLDRLTGMAACTAAKVVLVGDPGQIGVINGPGGMLAALAHAGHGIELREIHRFHQSWEREASLHLRSGDARALAAYRDNDRLHPCPDSDSALDSVFEHWHQARAAGLDALMLARTRQDVDALNARARAAAIEAGQLTGPIVSAAGRDWQAGDLLRTRRNDRQIPVGDSHVRNGDRYRVLGVGPDNGLIAEDMTGRGRTMLPATYVAEHADYGWASTIDAAQGATSDIGIVLVRPGLDREHLYVALTRGRQANHAYITPDPLASDDPRHRPGRPPGRAASQEREDTPASRGQAAMGETVQVLAASLAQTGAQDAAHTALQRARRVAEDRQVLAGLERRNAVVDDARARLAAEPVPEAHRRAAEELTALKNQRDALGTERFELEQRLRTARADLASCPRWARVRKNELAHTISASHAALQRTAATYKDFNDRAISLTAVVDSQRRERTERAAQELRDTATMARTIARRPGLAMPRRPDGPGARRSGLTTPALFSQHHGRHDRDAGRDLGRGI
jgi:conjugative relaxase-like TrwC/TraI family protein